MSTTSTITLTNDNLTGDHESVLMIEGKAAVPGSWSIYTSTLNIQGQLIGAQDVTLNNGGELHLYAGSYPNGAYMLDNLDIVSGTLTLASYDNGDAVYNDGSDNGFTLEANNITIGSGSAISADGLGYALSRGPGAHNSGASHAGVGRGGAPTYGSVYTAPATLGSSGNHGRGGGALHLVVSDTFTLDGELRANGLNDGSGGSIWLQVNNSLTGSGSVQANGGSRSNEEGGGGWLAIYAPDHATYTGSYEANFTGSACPAGKLCHGVIYLGYGEVDPLVSTVATSPASIPANGVAGGTLTVTLRSITGSLVSNEPVSVRLQNGDAAHTYANGQALTEVVALGTTNSQGMVTATITSTTAETKTFELSSGVVRLLEPGLMVFDADLVDAQTSTMAVLGSATAPANGTDTITVKVTARDKFDNLVPGVEVSLAALPGVTFTPSDQTTDAQGETTFQAGYDQPAVVVISATIDGQQISDTVSVTFEGPDLDLTLAGPPEITQGYPLTYTVTIANQGPLTATNVVVTDTLPAEVSFVNQTGSYPFITTTNTVVWNVGELPPQDSETFSLQVVVPPTATLGVMTNTLSGSLAEVDLDLTNNQAEQTVNVLAPVTELVVNPSGETNLPVQVGTTALLTVSLSNPGTGPLQNVIVAPPPHIDWVTVDPASISSIGPGETRQAVISAGPPLTQAVGRYWDVITITNGSGLDPQYILLKAYAHPVLVDPTVVVKNNLDNPVDNALLSLEKTTPSVHYTEGQPGSYQVQYLNYHTNANGEVDIADVEVGTYQYTLSAYKHLPNPATGLITVTETTTQIVLTDLQALPTLTFTPNQLRAGVLAGSARSQIVQVRNNGPATPRIL